MSIPKMSTPIMSTVPKCIMSAIVKWLFQYILSLSQVK